MRRQPSDWQRTRRMGLPNHSLSTRTQFWWWPAVLLVLLQPAREYCHGDDVVDDTAAASRYFSDSVLPLLKKHCHACHSHDADAVEGGLVLDSRRGWQIGGDSGPAIVPSEPAKSLLLKAVDYSDTELQMPPDGRLPQREIDILGKWITDGAFDPRVAESRPLPGARTPKERSARLWSLQPVDHVEVPDIDDAPWIVNDVDRFVLAKLRQRGVVPNATADRYALLRRATFDLTGLPPTLKEIDEFISDEHPDAWERLIERLLDSPHYGERWGRHWLDLARYGDSNGGDINYAYANAWRYRDYVIKSFNDDKPYDTFIREQLAGDLLSDNGDMERRRELLTATGFLMLGPKMLAEVDTEKLLIDIVDEQLDVTGLTFLGMTFGCARCHDHKFDPITAEDYYAMAGIFRSTKVIDVLRPSNGVSEWLEIDVTPDETRQAILSADREKQRLQQLLADLGGSPANEIPGNNAARKAIFVSNLPSLKSTTWAAWVRISQPQTLGAVVSATYDGANQGHSLGFDRGSTPRIVWNHGSGAHTIIAASKPVSFDTWHHVALTFDAAFQKLQLFVDGSVAAKASNVSTSEFSTISVGRREASQQWQFNGDVDEVQVYDCALSESQMHDLFERHSAAETPLLHWNFDDSRDNSVVDSGTGGFHGRLVGVSALKNIIRDGVIRAAFSFSAIGDDSQPPEKHMAEIADVKKQIQQIESTMPRSMQVMAVAASTPVDLPVHLRGSHLKRGKTPIARSTPKVFEHALAQVTVSPEQNGRLQLADWIASPRNPLTARVMVNRIWQHHFGTGLVRTPSNFGVRGEIPSHPKLLDWLANEFVARDWSIGASASSDHEFRHV